MHTKPDDPSPADLELDRQILNEDLHSITHQVLAAMDKRLMVSWQPLLDFLQQLSHLEEQRNKLMGQQCQATMDEFVEKQELRTFSTLWQQQEQQQQQGMTEMIKMVDNYLDDLIKHVQGFLNDFVNPRLEQIGQLIQDLWDLVGPTIQHMAERMATHEERDKGNAENCKAVSQSLKGLHSTKEVDEAIDRIQHAMADRVDDYITSVQELKKTYADNDNNNVDMIQHKDFRRRVKRLEVGYTSLRQFFRYEVTQKIFPETLFCKFSLVCLGALMQEGEVMEAMIIETEVKRFIESHRSLVKRRQSIVVQYEEGVQAGRRELAGILGKLFLKEGMRIQGENLALKRQAKLLKSMGVDEGGSNNSSNSNRLGGGNNGVNQGKSEPGNLSKKKKKNKKKKVAATSASTLSIENSDTNNDTTSTAAAAAAQENDLDSKEAPVDTKETIIDNNSPSIPSFTPPTSTLTAQSSSPPSDEPKTLPSPVPVKKNKVLTIPPSPASTYVPPPPIDTTPSSSHPSIKPTLASKNTPATTHKAKSFSPKPAPTSNKASSTAQPPVTNTSASKKNNNIPGATALSSTSNGNKSTKSSTKKVSSPPPLSPASKSAKSTVAAVSVPSTDHQAPTVNVTKEPEDKKIDMAELVHQLQQDREEMESKMKTLQETITTMQQQYMEQQQQTWQWYEQQQTEKKEMQRYIQQLEQQVKQYQQQQQTVGPVGGSTPVSCSSSTMDQTHWLTAGFGNQDLFAGYRQEMQSYQQPPYYPPPF
ncbi:hypothetical protein BC941DRAFT_437276 [Chlamydoabsidia padenii]|nr:hypothetical protein BC941DRAFT_437276 [Chlamydoabsidia padenii]